jgi:hypothetical protein
MCCVAAFRSFCTLRFYVSVMFTCICARLVTGHKAVRETRKYTRTNRIIFPPLAVESPRKETVIIIIISSSSSSSSSSNLSSACVILLYVVFVVFCVFSLVL